MKPQPKSPETLRGVYTDMIRASAAELARERREAAAAQTRRNREAAASDEIYSEGHKHRNLLPNRKDP